MSANLTEHGARQTERLAMHLGLMSILVQRGSPLQLIQSQAIHLRTVLKEIVDLEDEPPNAIVHITQFLPDDVAELLAEGVSAPDDLEGI